MATLSSGVQYLTAGCPLPLTREEESAAARRLLLRLLRLRYGIGALPEISVTPEGKPYFPSRRDIHFSISHCPTAVAVAVADSPVGCDIEMIQEDISPQLLEVAFSPKEQTEILSAPDPCEAFTRLWTRKEAYVKCQGHIPDDPRDWPSSPIAPVSRLTTIPQPEHRALLSIAEAQLIIKQARYNY